MTFATKGPGSSVCAAQMCPRDSEVLKKGKNPALQHSLQDTKINYVAQR